MASSIDITKPITGNPTTQSVRDNFSAAKTEIEALQTDKADLASPTFTGTLTAANLTATGTVTFTGATVADGGSVTTVDINGGTIDATAIGGSTPAAGAFTTLGATGAATLTSATFSTTVSVTGELTTTDIYVDGTGSQIILDDNTGGSTQHNFIESASGNIRFLGAATKGGAQTLLFSHDGTDLVVPSIDVAAGEIDGTAIGANSASTGAFTTLSASGAASFTSTLNVSSAANLHVEGSDLVTGFKRFRALTQATYDGLTPDSNTIYFIT